MIVIIILLTKRSTISGESVLVSSSELLAGKTVGKQCGANLIEIMRNERTSLFQEA